MRSAGIGRGVHDSDDDDGPALQEGAAGAPKSRAGICLPRSGHAKGNGRRSRHRTRSEPASARWRRAAADSVFTGRCGVGPRSRAARRARTSDPREATRHTAEAAVSDYLLHGGTLALAWFLLVNIVASGCVAAWVRREAV